MRRSSRVQEIAEEALERMTPVIEEAKEKLAPYVEEARTQANERIVPAAEHAAEAAKLKLNESVVPQVSAALLSAAAASEPYRKEAKRRGAATLAAARGEIDAPKESHKLRNLLVLLGLAGLVTAAVAYFKKDDSSAWESDYPPSGPTAVPDPATPASSNATDPLVTAGTAGAAGSGTASANAGGPAMDTDTADDTAAAGPDEALADADEHPHRPTDPDNPLERKDL